MTGLELLELHSLVESFFPEKITAEMIFHCFGRCGRANTLLPEVFLIPVYYPTGTPKTRHWSCLCSHASVCEERNYSPNFDLGIEYQLFLTQLLRCVVNLCGCECWLVTRCFFLLLEPCLSTNYCSKPFSGQSDAHKTTSASGIVPQKTTPGRGICSNGSVKNTQPFTSS